MSGVSRRQLLFRAAVTAGGFGLTVGVPAAAARRPRAGVTYRLRATELCSCSACRHHAANKLFATRAAAEAGRAHVGCQCEVVRSSAIGAGHWRKLFGSPHELLRTAVDRRHPATRRVLGRRGR